MSAAPAAAQGTHYDYLDGWRGLAICLLLVGHFFPVPGVNLGTLGVNFFFVLSGYLMARLLFVQQTPIGVFYRRRIARIVPAHLAFVGLTTTFWMATGRPSSVSEVLAAAFFVNNYLAPAPGQSLMPFGHIWSLSVEEHSYVLLSLLAIAVRARLADVLTGFCAITAACVLFAFSYAWCCSGPDLQFGLWLHTEVSGYGIFASGLLLLWLRQHPSWKWPPLTAPLLVAAGVCLHWWSVPLPIQKVLGVGALALAVNLLAGSPSLLRQLLAWRPLRLMGLWSFSIYVWQQPFYLWSRHGSLPIWLGLLFAVCAGVASFYLLEQPARSWLNQNWGTGKTAADSGAKA